MKVDLWWNRKKRDCMQKSSETVVYEKLQANDLTDRLLLIACMIGIGKQCPLPPPTPPFTDVFFFYSALYNEVCINKYVQLYYLYATNTIGGLTKATLKLEHGTVDTNFILGRLLTQVLWCWFKNGLSVIKATQTKSLWDVYFHHFMIPSKQIMLYVCPCARPRRHVPR